MIEGVTPFTPMSPMHGATPIPLSESGHNNDPGGVYGPGFVYVWSSPCVCKDDQRCDKLARTRRKKELCISAHTLSRGVDKKWSRCDFGITTCLNLRPQRLIFI